MYYLSLFENLDIIISFDELVVSLKELSILRAVKCICLQTIVDSHQKKKILNAKRLQNIFGPF
jgi:hypothetical protein